MLRSPHILAAIVTVVAVIIFLILFSVLHLRFGLRTYWPGFVCLYLLVWYYSRIKMLKSDG